jgi:hypothetical protein
MKVFTILATLQRSFKAREIPAVAPSPIDFEDSEEEGGYVLEDPYEDA